MTHYKRNKRIILISRFVIGALMIAGFLKLISLGLSML